MVAHAQAGTATFTDGSPRSAHGVTLNAMDAHNLLWTATHNVWTPKTEAPWTPKRDGDISRFGPPHLAVEPHETLWAPKSHRLGRPRSSH